MGNAVHLLRRGTNKKKQGKEIMQIYFSIKITFYLTDHLLVGIKL